MRPEFGCGIHDQIFSPMDATTAGRVAYDVRSALDRWEPRIDVGSVDVSYDESKSGVMYVDINYTERETNDRRNLVFPFYVIPEGQEG
jgi:phage baseplate assembly protein W